MEESYERIATMDGRARQHLIPPRANYQEGVGSHRGYSLDSKERHERLPLAILISASWTCGALSRDFRQRAPPSRY